MTTTQTTATLDIDLLPEELYDMLLAEFRAQHGEGVSFTDWQITATAQTEE